MPTIHVKPLGAGLDVGGSCVLVTLGGKTIMFDCGMHMGYNDERRFPDFTAIAPTGPYTKYISCLIISHFHLDHCGALPHFTERLGYNGPIYMTYPTKAIVPILLSDYRRITAERRGEKDFFTEEHIQQAMQKVTPINLRQLVQVDDKLSIRAWYGSHVLGAGIWELRVGSETAIYSGDYNMTPDRHLGSAHVPRLRPDILITETTYCTTIRDSKRARERDFLKRVHECVAKGGKVLLPVFALGRAQELMLLLDSYWERMNLAVPIYFCSGMGSKANTYYNLFTGWMNERVKEVQKKRPVFDSRHIKPIDPRLGASVIETPGPMVLIASPGMLHVGFSFEVFKKWAPSELNLVIMPGYCVAGTTGHRILNGATRLEFEGGRGSVDIRCKVISLSFSAHVDAKGIMQLISMVEPRSVLLVHGEKEKMAIMKEKIQQDFGIPCYAPANHGEAVTATSLSIPVTISTSLLPGKRLRDEPSVSPALQGDAMQVKKPRFQESMVPLKAALVISGRPDSPKVSIVASSELGSQLGLPEHSLKFATSLAVPQGKDAAGMQAALVSALNRWIEGEQWKKSEDGSICARSVRVEFGDASRLRVSWAYEDEAFALRSRSILACALDTLPATQSQ
eukprot:m51a1_g2956 putative integrator complex subunit 11-like (624) ;mRNA; r:657748-660403